MTGDQVIRLVAALGELLGVLVWPALILFLIIRFQKPLSDFVSHLSELTLKAAGVEASVRLQQVKVAAALGAASAKQTDPSEIAETVAAAVPDTRTQQRLQGRFVLWVDDRPDDDRYERQALEVMGVRFALSTSTDDALVQVRYQTFDLIISDMARPPDPQAGLTLLIRLRDEGNPTPYVLYTDEQDPERVQEAQEHGAYGLTASPQELIRSVTLALGSAP